MTKYEDSLKKTEAQADMIITAIDKTELPEEVKRIGKMNAALGVNTEKIMNLMIAGTNAFESRKASEEAPKQKEFSDYTPVERQVALMLTEDTGADIADSGEAYGRNWQRNRLVEDFRTRPEISIETWVEKEKVRAQPMMTKHTHISVPLIQKTPTKMRKPSVTISVIPEDIVKEIEEENEDRVRMRA